MGVPPRARKPSIDSNISSSTADVNVDSEEKESKGAKNPFTKIKKMGEDQAATIDLLREEFESETYGKELSDLLAIQLHSGILTKLTSLCCETVVHMLKIRRRVSGKAT